MPTNQSTQAAQARSLPLAKNWGQGWDGFELDLVKDGASATAEELAYMLDRTVYAVQNVREALRKGRPVGSDRQAPTPSQVRTYTFLDGDCPPGWDD